MEFLKVSMENFMAIKEAELELQNRGLVLIEGINKSNDSFTSNGASKTTLISAITYALYGRTEKGLKADEVVNNIEKKNTKVVLDFKIGEDLYRIERYRKHKIYKNKVALFCNDKEITGATADVTDKEIQRLFGIEFNTYVNAIMYGQGDMPMFSQATDKGKKEILESITNVAVYKTAQDIAKERIKFIENEQVTKEMKISSLRSNLIFLQNRESEEKERYQETLKRKEDLEKEISGDTLYLEELEVNTQEAIKSLKAQLSNVESSEYQYPEDYHKALEGLTRVADNKSKIQQKVQEITFYIGDNKKKIRSLDTSDTCPTCGAPLDNTHKVKERQSLEGANKTYEDALNILDEKSKLVLKSEHELLQVTQHYDREKNNHDAKIMETYNNQQNVLRQIQQEENKVISFKHNLELKKERLNSLSESQPYDSTEEQKKVQKEIDSLATSVLELERKKENYKKATEAFSNSGIRSVVLDFITPFLNQKSNEYLQVLSGSDIGIEFQTQVKNAKGELKDKFDVIVTNKNGGKSYKANSAGEQKRIDLAISFAIQDLVMSKEDISTNIALYDECFDGLDIIGCENVIKLLKDRLETVPTIFVITHNENLKSLFEKSITMIKENGVSRLKGDTDESNDK